MDPETRLLVQALHDAPPRIMLVTAGAGTLALSNLLNVAGATRTLLEALVPYSAAAFNDFLEQKPSQYVAPRTAKLLAGRALTRARWLEDENRPSIGLACTATIITDRPKRGDHRAHIACWQANRVVWRHLNLQKGARQREGEEEMVSRLMLNTLAEACGLPNRLSLPLLPGDHLEEDVNDFSTAVTRLLAGDLSFFGVHDHGLIRTEHVQPQVLLSGAFNPLHDGHLGMMRAAAGIMEKPVAFELSALNVDKPPLAPDVILDRLAQFAGRYPIYISRAATFAEKAALYPGCTFVVGYDTAVRVLQPRYYNGSEADMTSALATIQAQDCSFLVAGRVDDNDRFRTVTDLQAPPPYRDLFHPIPEKYFRKDISSTELRRHNRKGSR